MARPVHPVLSDLSIPPVPDHGRLGTSAHSATKGTGVGASAFGELDSDGDIGAAVLREWPGQLARQATLAEGIDTFVATLQRRRDIVVTAGASTTGKDEL